MAYKKFSQIPSKCSYWISKFITAYTDKRTFWFLFVMSKKKFWDDFDLKPKDLLSPNVNRFLTLYSNEDKRIGSQLE